MIEERELSQGDLKTYPNSEIWLPVAGWPGYEVSSLGNIRFRGEPRTLTERPEGYLVVGLWDFVRKEGKTKRVNIIVCTAFHGPAPFPKAEVRHKNHRRNDNRQDNLCWGSRSDNMQDMVKAGRATTGGRNKTSKLDWDKAREIRRLHAEEGISGRQLGIRFGVNTQTINCLLRGVTWKEEYNV